jgi:hypothetical protein
MKDQEKVKISAGKPDKKPVFSLMRFEKETLKY